MQEGLLWFDNDPNRRLRDKIKRAATCYQRRLHHKPTVCFLNASDFDDKLNKVDGIDLKTATNVRPNYFWIGVEHKASRSRVA